MKAKHGIIEVGQEGYADDHTLLNRTPRGTQDELNLISRWLKWTLSMMAKPSKCRSFGLCRNNVSYRAGDPNTKTYTPFDPKLFIVGCLIRFIGNDPFKFLGRIVYTHLTDYAQRKLVLDKLHEDMHIVDAIHLKGIAKAWLYNNYIIAFLS